MKARALQILRLIRGIVTTAVAILIIGAAVIVGAGRLLVPYADHLRPQVERLLVDRTGQPVSISRVEAGWSGLLPVFSLYDLRIGEEGDQAVSIAQVQLEIDPVDLVRPARNPAWLAMDGLEITLAQRPTGGWSVGLDTPALEQPARFDPARIDLGNLRLRNSRLRIVPHDHRGRVFELPDVRLHTGAGSIALAGRIEPGGGGGQSIELRLIANFDGTEPTAVRAWLSGRDLSLHHWLGQPAENGLPSGLALLSETRLSFQGWLDWADGETGRLHGDFKLDRWPAGRSAEGGDSRTLASRFLLERDRDGLQLNIEPFEAGAPESAFEDFQLATDGERWAIAAERIDLAPFHTLLLPWPVLEKWLPGHVSGTVERLRLAGDFDGSLSTAAGHVRRLSVAPVRRIPGVEGLDLDIALDGDLAAITLGGENPLVDWRGMLRAPVELDSLSGRVLLGPDVLIMEHLAVTHPAADATAEGLIAWADGVPFLDFHVDVPRVTPDDPRPFLPAAIIPDTVLAWLDHALTGGERARGRLQFFGNPRQWPWDSGVGEFLAHIEIEDADLGIYPGWPRAEALRGEVVFQGRGMSGHTDHGRIGGMAVKRADVRIDDLRNGSALVLNVDAPALDAGTLDAFLETLPALDGDAGGENLVYGGLVDLRLDLELPLKSSAGRRWELSGTAETQSLSVEHGENLFRLDPVQGGIRFSRNRIGPASLEGKLNGGEVAIDVEGVPGEQARVVLSGQLSPDELIPPAWRDGMSGPLPAGGRSNWRIEIDRREDATTLSAASDLVGTRLDLPAPLQKPEDVAWELALGLPVYPEMDRFSFTLGEGVSLAAERDGTNWRWGLGLGGERAPVPAREQFIVRGHLNRVDLGGWLRTAGALGTEMGARWPDAGGRMLLEINELVVGSRTISDVTLNLRREQPHWLVDVVGTGANGQLRLPASETAAHVAVGDFRRLHLSTPAETDPDDRDDPETPAPLVTIDPRTLPDLHLLVEDLRLGDLHAGRARVEAHGTADGLEIETVQAGHEALRLSGRGRWRMVNDQPASEFDLSLHFLDAQQLLRSAGFESTMNAHSGELSLRAVWPGSPMDFDLRRLSGSLLMDLTDGILPEARPGLGRVLSLISLSALPRRLQLDFRDVVGTGFAFDSLKGNFTLARGLAETEDLEIKSSAADIRITGTADLVNQEYDQEIFIRPGLGATLPVIGAIAGGPGGAAAGLALQGLLGGSLRDIGEIHYRVTGPWDDPEVEVTQDD